jgi:hypothetical protein
MLSINSKDRKQRSDASYDGAKNSLGFVRAGFRPRGRIRNLNTAKHFPLETQLLFREIALPHEVLKRKVRAGLHQVLLLLPDALKRGSVNALKPLEGFSRVNEAFLRLKFTLGIAGCRLSSDVRKVNLTR